MKNQTPEKMDWLNLFSKKRFNHEGNLDTKIDKHTRSPFQRDYDRIIFSSPFRRLQSKTQVLPLPGVTFVHNRLTHSLEVASIGKSLATIIGSKVIETSLKNRKDEIESNESKFNNTYQDAINFYRYDFPNVIAAACLAHDIGNPPFGHSGEESISSFFQDDNADWKKIELLIPKSGSKKLTNAMISDLSHFEGNANSFRLLARYNNGKTHGVYGFTCTTLAAIVKYPCDSVNLGYKKEHPEFTKKHASAKKYGFFQTEKDMFEKIAEELGIPKRKHPGKDCTLYFRHPFVFIVEAADDICYLNIDFEDAHRRGIISTDDTISHFEIFFKELTGKQKRDIWSDLRNSCTNSDDKNLTDEVFQSKYIDKFKEEEKRILNEKQIEINEIKAVKDNNQRVSLLRSRVCNRLIEECVDVFEFRYEQMLSGEYDNALLDDNDFISQSSREGLAKLKKTSELKIYNNHQVVEMELAGRRVLNTLLEEFIQARLRQSDKRSFYDKKFLHLLPLQYSDGLDNSRPPIADIAGNYDSEIPIDDSLTPYEKIRIIVDYVSNMTDPFAVDLYTKIKGIKFPTLL